VVNKCAVCENNVGHERLMHERLTGYR
jgi:hypothetical protein